MPRRERRVAPSPVQELSQRGRGRWQRSLSDSPIFDRARSGERLPGLLLATPLLVVFSLSGFALAYVPALAIVGDLEKLPLIWRDFYGYVVPLALVVAILWLWLAFGEKRPFRTLGFVGDKPLAKYLLGFLFGTGLLGLTVAFMAIAGVVVVDTRREVPSGIDALGAVLLFLFAFAVQAGSEEILFRGWFFPVLGARHKPWIGLVVSSVVFAAMHATANPIAVLNLLLFAVLLTLYTLKEKGLWGACGWHAGWNWAAGNLFGLEAAKRAPEGGTVFDLQTIGSSLLSGGAMGPKYGLMATAALTIGVIALLLAPGAGIDRKHRPHSR